MKSNWIRSGSKAFKDSPWQTILRLQLKMQMVATENAAENANSTTFSWNLGKKKVPEKLQLRNVNENGILYLL